MLFFRYFVNGRRVSYDVARDIAEIYITALEVAAKRLGRVEWAAGPSVTLIVEVA
jgi:hypothetical protein